MPLAASLSCDESIELPTFGVVKQPFPHVLQKPFLPAPLFSELRESFPPCPPSSGPTGYSLYWGDERYQNLLERSPAWQTLFNAFQSQRFVEWAQRQFAAEWLEDGCKIDFTRARYVPYFEDRTEKELAALRKGQLTPHELWVRMDIYQGHVGYARNIHRDHARRVLTMLIYFSDHEEDGMSGGELLLHPRPLRRWRERPVSLAPRENLMIAFPCSNRSYHSVAEIASARRPRNYMQIQISSSGAASNRS